MKTHFKTSFKSNKRFICLLVAIFVSSLVFSTSLNESKASALDGSQFNPGRIIDDAVFYNNNSMNAAQIQAFLDAKLPSCDTNGNQSQEYYFNQSTGEVNNWNDVMDGDVWVSTTRAIYGARVADYGGEWRGSRAPYTCFNTYRQTTVNIAPESGLCNGYTGVANETTAQMLYKISQSCGINPQVLIVLLQKEQSLISDTWPWDIQYDKATGVSCPDSYPAEWAPYNCDPDYLGFFKQMYYGAHRFKKYKANASNYNYKAGRNNTIYWNPNANCGTSNVFIENQATAALYIYTPYRPNDSALYPNSGPQGLYGLGDGCSSYGNRNFWRMFSDWFGNTQRVPLPGGCEESVNTAVDCVWRLRSIIDDQQYLLSSTGDRNFLLDSGQYVFEGTYFYGNSKRAPKPWNIPIYRLIKPNGSSFLTASTAERDYLKTLAWVDKGIDFYANPASNTSNAGYAIYRMYSPTSGNHAWVTTLSQKNEYIQKGYNYEGIAFHAPSQKNQESPPADGKNHVYRFYISSSNSHFYTSSLSGRDGLIGRNDFVYEGVSWSTSAIATAKPVYRLYSQKVGEHIFTTDTAERTALLATKSWVSEGISHYASAATNLMPVYRLYSSSMNRHFFTSDILERNYLQSNGTYQYEGVGWYQP